MAWTIKNNLTGSDVKVRKFAWVSEAIKAFGGEYTSDWKSLIDGGDLDITVEGVSGYLVEFIMNPTIVATTVNPDKNTRIELSDGGYDSIKKKYTVKTHITDNKGRNEYKSGDFDVNR